MKDRLARIFPSDASRSFEVTKRLSDYTGALARLVFVGSITMLALYSVWVNAPALSLAYIGLIAITLYFGALTMVIFASFSWLTAWYLHNIVFGEGRPSLIGIVTAAAASTLLMGALAVAIYQIAENSSIVRGALSSINVMDPQ